MSKGERTEYIQITTTVETKKDASRLAQLLVESRAAACVQVLGPIESTYRWRGEVEVSQEWQCLIKTERRLFPEVQNIVNEHHPYDVPELIGVPIVEGSAEYFRWISLETGRHPGNEGEA